MIYKQASYEGKGRNPFYFMSYVEPRWFFEDKIIIHPNCKEIVDSVCYDFVDLENVVFPIGLIKIGDNAFAHCRDLNRIILEEGLKYLGERAFASCSNVKRIELPSTLKTIGEGCFELIDSLATLIYHGTVEQWEKVRKGKDWLYGDHELDIKCNDGSVHVSSRIRYSRYSDKDKYINKELLKDEIKEVISLPVKERIERAKEIYNSFYNYLVNGTGFSDDDRNIILLGMSKLFISASGGFKDAHFKRFKKICGLNVSYENFKRKMTMSSKLEDGAFDLITCSIPAFRRLNFVIIGAALVCENKRLTWNAHRLINEIMGPLK